MEMTARGDVRSEVCVRWEDGKRDMVVYVGER